MQTCKDKLVAFKITLKESEWLDWFMCLVSRSDSNTIDQLKVLESIRAQITDGDDTYVSAKHKEAIAKKATQMPVAKKKTYKRKKKGKK